MILVVIKNRNTNQNQNLNLNLGCNAKYTFYWCMQKPSSNVVKTFFTWFPHIATFSNNLYFRLKVILYHIFDFCTSFGYVITHLLCCSSKKIGCIQKNPPFKCPGSCLYWLVSQLLWDGDSNVIWLVSTKKWGVLQVF